MTRFHVLNEVVSPYYLGQLLRGGGANWVDLDLTKNGPVLNVPGLGEMGAVIIEEEAELRRQDGQLIARLVRGVVTEEQEYMLAVSVLTSGPRK